MHIKAYIHTSMHINCQVYTSNASMSVAVSKTFNKTNILFYSIIVYSILFYFTLFYAVLLCSIMLYSILPILFYSILFYSFVHNNYYNLCDYAFIMWKMFTGNIPERNGRRMFVYKPLG